MILLVLACAGREPPPPTAAELAAMPESSLSGTWAGLACNRSFRLELTGPDVQLVGVVVVDGEEDTVQGRYAGLEASLKLEEADATQWDLQIDGETLEGTVLQPDGLMCPVMARR